MVLETELLDYLQTFHANAKNRLPKPNKQYLQNLAAKGLLQAGSCLSCLPMSLVLVLSSSAVMLLGEASLVPILVSIQHSLVTAEDNVPEA